MKRILTLAIVVSTLNTGAIAQNTNNGAPTPSLPVTPSVAPDRPVFSPSVRTEKNDIQIKQSTEVKEKEAPKSVEPSLEKNSH